ncbi:MAG: hypothetical protein QOJ11_2965 [Frankiales bacterium]|jgi:beta-lactamase superfamily II metal-dependent hydrolase|nr:hypothetical protein [Frankiales bacterium]
MIVPRETSFDGAPSDDEVEVTVLGPGYGECVLVHVGGRWMVIDSYETATGEQHPALKYLEFRLVPLTAVQWLVATHWHDDHVGDFDRLVERLPDIPIVVSAAMDQGELLSGLLRIPSAEHRSNGVAVFQRVSEIADDRDSGLEFGKAGVPLVLRDLPVGIGGRLDLLSPSSSTMQHGFEQVSRLLRVVADGHRVRVPRPRRNHLAVAGWFRAQWQPSDEPPGEEVSILLGADLEVTAHPRRGWKSVHRGPFRPSGIATAVKAAHHGSLNGFHPPFWRDSVDPSAIVVIAPWRRAGRQLPTAAGVERLKATAGTILVTSMVREVQEVRNGRVRVVEEDLPGRVTLRRKLGKYGQETSWTYELGDAARAL